MALNTQQTSSPVNWGEYGAVLSQCKSIVEEIRNGVVNLLYRYHGLGKILVAANFHRDQMRRLANDLGYDFSQSTLYRCMQFAQQFPDVEAFIRDYGLQSWRNVARVLVTRPRNSHACEIKISSLPPDWRTLSCPYCRNLILMHQTLKGTELIGYYARRNVAAPTGP